MMTTSGRRPRRVRGLFAALAGLTLLTVLTACGDDDGGAGSDAGDETPSAAGSSSPPPTPPAGISINVGTWAAGEPGLDAALTGTVQISDTGCVVLQQAGKSAEAVDVLWPAGSELVQVGTNPIEIRNSGGEPVARIGTRLQLSGGVLDSKTGMPELECDVAGGTSAFAITQELAPLPGS
jgi:hypothetical protein